MSFVFGIVEKLAGAFQYLVYFTAQFILAVGLEGECGGFLLLWSSVPLLC